MNAFAEQTNNSDAQRLLDGSDIAPYFQLINGSQV
jgi:hypothetical protein